MEEKEKFSVDTEDLKKETKDTVNQVKDTIKNVDFKNDAVATKGFLKEMFTNPIEAIKRAASSEEGIFKKAIMILLVYIVAELAYAILYVLKYGEFSGFMDNIMDIVSGALYPIAFVLVPAVIVYVMNKNNKKPLTTVIATMIVGAVPVIINSVIDLVDFFVSGLTIVTGPIGTMLSALSIILTYFGMKDLFAEEDDAKFIKKCAVIKVLAAFILVVLGRIGIV